MRNKRREKMFFFAFGMALALIMLLAVAHQVLKTKNQEKSYIEQSSQTKIQDASGQWLYKGTHVKDNIPQEDKKYFDQLIEKWMKGLLTDAELSDWMMQHWKEAGRNVNTIGVMSRQVCLFESENDIPDYEMRLQSADSMYEFIGLYTEGKKDKDNNLICYYWEAGIS